MNFSQNDTLIQSLHSGLLEEPLWNEFLTGLRTRLDVDFCCLYVRNSKRPMWESLELFASKGVLINPRYRYLGDLYRLDPIPYDSLQLGRVYSLDEFIGPSDPRHQTYMNELMRPSGIRHLRIMRVCEESGYNAWMILWRAKRNFLASEAALLEHLAPHLTIALRNYARLERECLRSGIADEAIRRLNFGWVTLDQKGHVVDLDDIAQRLLQRSTMLRRTMRGRLLPTSRETGKALADSLRLFAEKPESRSRAIHLSNEPWLDMLLVPMRNRISTGAMVPAVIAYIHGDNETSSYRVEQLMDLFGLTRSEATLALALARGRSIAEAAAELSITIQTARYYSKRIYSKTGTRGQADLVRIILTGVLALA